jgi:RNA recognition motif-containing protein
MNNTDSYKGHNIPFLHYIGKERKSQTMEEKEKNKLFVSSLPFDMKNEELESLFKPYGKVKVAFVVQNRGFGFVQFENVIEADSALEAMNGMPYQERNLKIAYANPKQK